LKRISKSCQFSRNTGRIAKSWKIFLPCFDYQEDPFALLQDLEHLARKGVEE
jgi:hypothetical protein